jgi:hypothetical protein
MRHIVQAVSLVVCLAVAVGAGAPRGLVLAAIAASVGLARTLYARQADAPRFDVVSIKRNTSGQQGGKNGLDPGAYTGINVTCGESSRLRICRCRTHRSSADHRGSISIASTCGRRSPARHHVRSCRRCSGDCSSIDSACAFIPSHGRRRCLR